MDKKDLLDQTILASDENNVMRENTRLDILLKRDPYKYMRLHGTEASFFKIEKVLMYKKNEEGKYELLNLQSDSLGTLVLTTRRLTYSILSRRGSYSTFIPLVGRWNYLAKERDFIKYSIPNFLLTGSLIKGDFNTKFFLGSSNSTFEWEIRNEGIKFEFNVSQKVLKRIQDINFILERDTEHLLTYIKYFYGDTDLYPGFDFDRHSNNEPIVLKKITSEERKNLLKELIASYSYYWFFGESESKEEIEKNYKIEPNLNNKKSLESNQEKNQELKIEERSKIEKSHDIKKEIKAQPKTNSRKDQLKEFKQLFDEGLISEEEYTALKKKTLDL